MNPSLQIRLTSLRSLIQSVIDAGEKATPGPWKTDGDFLQNLVHDDLAQIFTDDNSETDATFIALTRNTAPQMARALLVHLVCIEDDIEMCRGPQGQASERLESILKEFNL